MSMINVDDRYLLIIEVGEEDQIINTFEYDKKNKKTGEIMLDPLGAPVKGVMYSQTAVVKLGRQVMEIKVPLEEGQPVYPVGAYLVDPRSYNVSNFGNLEFGFGLILIPLSEAKSK
ncbi:heavy metal transporter [Salmonella enterica]|nr:heavy metal transporter [Salmonella enterica]